MLGIDLRDAPQREQLRGGISLADLLDGYHLCHASRAELLRQLGRPRRACAADRRALG